MATSKSELITMRKQIIIGSIVGVLVLGGAWAYVQHTHTSTPTKTTVTAKKVTKPKATKVKPLTVAELKRKPALEYSSIIYYAIYHSKIQRWQELSDFKRGWQVEIYGHGPKAKHLVRPDKNSTAADKNLAPNWFRISTDDKIFYDSLIVHSFKPDMTATTTLSKIVTQLNHDHAVKKVRAMPDNMVIIHHAHQ